MPIDEHREPTWVALRKSKQALPVVGMERVRQLVQSEPTDPAGVIGHGKSVAGIVGLHRHREHLNGTPDPEAVFKPPS